MGIGTSEGVMAGVYERAHGKAAKPRNTHLLPPPSRQPSCVCGISDQNSRQNPNQHRDIQPKRHTQCTNPALNQTPCNPSSLRIHYPLTPSQSTLPSPAPPAGT